MSKSVLIILAIVYTLILYIIDVSLGTAWSIFAGIASIFSLLFIIVKNKYKKPLRTFTFKVFIVYFISSLLYSVVCFIEKNTNVYAVNKTSKIDNGLKIIEKSKETVYITPEDLEKELGIKPIAYFNPAYDPKHLVNLFLTKNTNITIKDDVMEKLQLLIETVKKNSENNMGTINNDESIKLNLNSSYTKLIREANDYEKSLKLNGENIDIYNNMISTREKAFEIGKTRELALLLARDYYELGSYYCYSLDNKQEAFSCFIKSIEHYNQVIKFTKVNEEYEVDLEYIFYLIGQVYHSIADIQYMEKRVKTDAYFMSLAYISLSIEQEEEQNFLSYYYRAMIGHKLGIILDKNDDKTLNEDKIFLDAKLNYEKCLNLTKDISTKINIQKFMADTCSELINYYEENDQDENIVDLVEEKQSLLYSVEKMKNLQ
jgi:tetratricopeptide (TPR) repeat protein